MKNIFTIADDEVFVGTNRFYSVNKASKILGIKGVGRNKLFELLRNKGMLNEYNIPLREWLDIGFFEIKNNGLKTVRISSHCINYIKKHYL